MREDESWVGAALEEAVSFLRLRFGYAEHQVSVGAREREAMALLIRARVVLQTSTHARSHPRYLEARGLLEGLPIGTLIPEVGNRFVSALSSIVGLPFRPHHENGVDPLDSACQRIKRAGELVEEDLEGHLSNQQGEGLGE